jgi:predicted phosphodiesterase
MKNTLLITDMHHGDDEYLLKYQIEYLKYLNKIVKKKEIKRIICLGDWSDKRSYIHYKTLAQITPLYYELMNFVDEFYFILGNHDSTYHNVNDIFSAKEIFSEGSKYTKAKVVFVQNDIYVIEDEKLILCPWIPKVNSENIISGIEKYNKEDYILFGHFEFKGFKTNDSYVMEKSQLKRSSYNKYKKVISGHYHLYQSKHNVCYIGSPMQTRYGEGTDHKTFMLNNVGELVDLYTHENLFIDIKIEKFDDDYLSEKLKNINEKKVKILIDTSDVDIINNINNYVSLNYKPYDVKYLFRDKEFIFDEIDVENKSNEENEKDFFDSLILDDDIAEEVKNKFYDYKNNRC